MALRGDLTRNEAIDLIKQATRRYAKRQMTWFRRHQEALRMEPDRISTEEMVQTVLKNF